MWNEHEYGLGLRTINRTLAEQVFKNRDLRQPWNSGQVLGLRILEHPAHQVGLAFAKPDHVLDFSLPNDRLCDAADVRVPRNRRNVHRGLQRHVAIRVNCGRYVDIDTDVEILKLRVNQRVDANSANSWLERT